MNQDIFFAEIKKRLFGGSMTQKQVDGINAILSGCQKYGVTDEEEVAYVLATAYWEVGQKMQPIREYGRGRGRPYGRPSPRTGHVYYGRGFVQLTWEDNYRILSGVVGVDLVNNPDKALELDIAVAILVVGMRDGLFTSKTGDGLNTYLGAPEDWTGARKLVNGTDRAKQIAGYAREFDAALERAGFKAPVKVDTPAPPVSEPPVSFDEPPVSVPPEVTKSEPEVISGPRPEAPLPLIARLFILLLDIFKRLK